MDHNGHEHFSTHTMHVTMWNIERPQTEDGGLRVLLTVDFRLRPLLRGFSFFFAHGDGTWSQWQQSSSMIYEFYW